MISEILELALGRQSHKCRSRTNFAQVRVMELEPRIMLTTFQYTGQGNTSAWTDPKNWKISLATNLHEYPKGPDDVAKFDTTPAGARGSGILRSVVDLNVLNSPTSVEGMTILGGFTGTIILPSQLTVQDFVYSNPNGGLGARIQGDGKLVIGIVDQDAKSAKGIVSGVESFAAGASLVVSNQATVKLFSDTRLSFLSTARAASSLLVNQGGVFIMDGGTITFTGLGSRDAVIDKGEIKLSNATILRTDEQGTQGGAFDIAFPGKLVVGVGITSIQTFYKSAAGSLTINDKSTLQLSGGGKFLGQARVQTSQAIDFEGPAAKLILAPSIANSGQPRHTPRELLAAA